MNVVNGIHFNIYIYLYINMHWKREQGQPGVKEYTVHVHIGHWSGEIILVLAYILMCTSMYIFICSYYIARYCFGILCSPKERPCLWICMDFVIFRLKWRTRGIWYLNYVISHISQGALEYEMSEMINGATRGVVDATQNGLSFVELLLVHFWMTLFSFHVEFSSTALSL